jgi:hypothetical protein
MIDSRISTTKDFHMLRHRLVSLCLAVLASSVLSCTDSTSPDSSDTRDPNDLRLLTAPYGTPSLAKTQVSFYAVQGKAGGVDIWYHASPGATDSLKFLEFRVGASSLATRADGSTIAAGDSVLITLTVTDQTHFIVDFQPSGLKFAPGAQPTLKISFAACGEDLNYDGVVDTKDQSIMSSLSFWRQEAPFQPWSKVPSTVVQTTKDVNAQIGGFTGYAIEF